MRYGIRLIKKVRVRHGNVNSVKSVAELESEVE